MAEQNTRLASIDNWLAEHGVVLPVLENDEWAFIPADSHVGKTICQLWLTAAPLLALCHNTRRQLLNVLVHESETIAFG